jgi:hypothetical protein
MIFQLLISAEGKIMLTLLMSTKFVFFLFFRFGLLQTSTLFIVRN